MKNINGTILISDEHIINGTGQDITIDVENIDEIRRGFNRSTTIINYCNTNDKLQTVNIDLPLPIVCSVIADFMNLR